MSHFHCCWLNQNAFTLAICASMRGHHNLLCAKQSDMEARQWEIMKEAAVIIMFVFVLLSDYENYNIIAIQRMNMQNM